MEGARLRSSVALPRVAAQPTVVEDNGEKLTIKAGQVVMCNLVSEALVMAGCQDCLVLR
jgi:linoleate 8R-lipoxygenase/9,12-octadecadienoate 8-hydroperoxide 8R-isomerase